MNNNEWIYTGDTLNGLQIYVKRIIIDSEKYMQVQYKLNGERVGEMQQYNIQQLRLLNSLADNL